MIKITKCGIGRGFKKILIMTMIMIIIIIIATITFFSVAYSSLLRMVIFCLILFSIE